LKNCIARNKEQGWPDVTVKEKTFAAEYLYSHDHRDAAELAGFPKSKGVALLRSPLVAAYLESLQEKVTIRRIIDRDFIESEMVQLYYMAKGEEEIHMVDKDGLQLSVKNANLPAARGILKDMAESTKFFEDGSSQGGTTTVTLNLGNLGIKPEVAKNATVRGTVIEGELSDE